MHSNHYLGERPIFIDWCTDNEWVPVATGMALHMARTTATAGPLIHVSRFPRPGSGNLYGVVDSLFVPLALALYRIAIT